MIKFSFVAFWLFVVCMLRTSSSHETKTPKCAKTPDTWKKVDAAIKECQEDVKLKIITDTFYSNEWDDSIFDDDGHFQFSDGHDDNLPIIDHSAIYGRKPHTIEDHPHIHDHHSHVSDHSSHNLGHGSIYDHHPHILDHHPQIHDHHPQIHDDHPQIHDHNPQTDDHHPQIHDHHPQIQDHHQQIHDHNPIIYDHSPKIHDHNPIIYDHSPKIHDHNPQIHNHHPQQIHEYHSQIDDQNPQIHDHNPQISDHNPQISDHNPQISDHNPKIHDTQPHNHHPQNHDHHPQIHEHHPQIHDHHPQIHDHHPKALDHQTPIHDSSKSEHFPTLLSYETLVHRPHELSPKPHHSHDVLQLKNPRPFSHPIHQDSTRNTVHMPEEHVKHTTSMSDSPIEQDHYIDFNEFRKKRHANEHGRIHSSTASYHDKRIAGCIMQCIYKKNHAVDKLGWPTLDGLVNFYSEGVNDHGYFMATLRAVDYCLKGSSAKYHVNRRSTPEKGQTCDVAFDVFDCISDQITEYCSDGHSD